MFKDLVQVREFIISIPTFEGFLFDLDLFINRLGIGTRVDIQ